MKKIGFIIVCLLCALTASALSYASPYKGFGRSGIYTTSSAQMHSFGSAGSGMAQAPVASMNSTSSSYGRGIVHTSTSVSMPQVACISTSASYIRGGVTTTQTYTPNGRIRRDPLPGGNPEGCECDWQYDPSLFGGEGGFYCTKCGAVITIDAYLNSIGHGDDPCGCAVPLQEGIDVWAFVAALAGVYALYKARARKEQLI